MIAKKLKERKAITDMKIFFIPIAVIGGLILGVGLNHIFIKSNSSAYTPMVNLPRTNNPGIHANSTEAAIMANNHRREITSKVASRNSENESGLAINDRIKLLAQRTKQLNNNKINPMKATGNIADNAQNSLLRVKDYIRGIEEKNAFLNEKVDLISDLMQAKEKEVSRLIQANADLQEELKKLAQEQNKIKLDFTEKLDSLKKEVEFKDTSIRELSAIKINLENEINEFKNKVASLVSFRASLQGQLDKLLEEKTFLEIELNKAKEELNKLQLVNNALNETVFTQREDLNKKEKANLAMVKALEELELSKEKMSYELTELKDIKLRNEDEISQLNDQVVALKVNLEETSRAATKASTLLSQRRLERELNVRNKDNIISNFKRDIEKYEKEKNILVERLEEKDGNISDLRLTLDNMENQLVSLQKRLASEQKTQSEFSEQIAKSESDKDNLKKILSDKDRELAELNAHLQAMEIQMKTLEQEIDSERNRQTGIDIQISEAENKKHTLTAALKEKEKDLESLTAKLRSMEGRMRDLQAELDLERKRQLDSKNQLESVSALNKVMKEKLKSIYVEIELLRSEKKLDVE